MQLSADQVGLGAAFPLSMSAAMAGGGTPQLDGKPGLWNTGNAVLTPVDTYRVIRDLDLVGVGLMERSDVTIAPSGIRADPARADIAELGNLTGQGGMAADGRFDFRMLVRLDKAITGAGSADRAFGWPARQLRGGRLLGGVLGTTTERGIGVHVTGTASAPGVKIEPPAVTSLIKVGLAGSRNTGAKTPGTGKSTRKKDVLNSLLQDALGSKSGH